MGNTLCKPVVQVQEQIVEQPKTIEPLLTEESIKILNIQNETKTESESILSTNEIVAKKDEHVLEPIKETQTVEPEPVLEPEIVLEPEVVETVLEPEHVLEPEVVETVLEPEHVLEPEVVVETLSIVQPLDEASSTSSKEEEEVPPLKKKRGRKKKGEQ